MDRSKKNLPETKSQLHPRNKHRDRYNFEALCKDYPALAPFVIRNKYNSESINFFDPQAVKALNSALLKHFYSIQYWDIPDGYLCPPIPGRADYIHTLADLLRDNETNFADTNIKCLDIGVGANCIYPIIGYKEYGWAFVGSDIDKQAINSARQIIDRNPDLKDHIEIRLQTNPGSIFNGIINQDEKFQFTICNPPFHSSAGEARKGTLRKLSNLKGTKTRKAKLNFGGQNNELWCEGGEKLFVRKMIEESVQFANSCVWFTTLVSKETNLPGIYKTLKKVKAKQIKTLNMGQGNKKSRIVAWSFQ
ncbi:23S rRNA (adenine(1618)-N(6))-methyltransferase RlmF [uncultured Draconibacterium sp.]|uniref:23S rRNA (adenine(1618)-N(6))-methyltransferase RlmF n=1 Tax=uncultured Draconibacterium sp. TaxID=1573823 RepID=UPI003216D7FA